MGIRRWYFFFRFIHSFQPFIRFSNPSSISPRISSMTASIF
jgi:hypothetical protein